MGKGVRREKFWEYVSNCRPTPLLVTRLEPVQTAVYTAGLTYRLYKRSWHDDLKPEKPAAPNSTVTEERKEGGGKQGGTQHQKGSKRRKHTAPLDEEQRRAR
jgi:hypothetical protein